MRDGPTSQMTEDLKLVYNPWYTHDFKEVKIVNVFGK